MKITKSKLKQIIKEELGSVMAEAAATDEEHMAEMVIAIATDAGILDKLRGLDDVDLTDAVENLMSGATGSGDESPDDVAPIVKRLLDGETL